MEYEVGDKVKIIDSGLDDWKKQYSGKVVTISALSYKLLSCYYGVEEDDGEWWWSENEFEKLVSVKKPDFRELKKFQGRVENWRSNSVIDKHGYNLGYIFALNLVIDTITRIIEGEDE